jgi:molecular chaperone DnaK
VLLSILVLISVPPAAMLLAYGYGNGHSIEQDARDVVADIARLLGLWLR